MSERLTWEEIQERYQYTYYSLQRFARRPFSINFKCDNVPKPDLRN